MLLPLFLDNVSFPRFYSLRIKLRINFTAGLSPDVSFISFFDKITLLSFSRYFSPDYSLDSYSIIKFLQIPINIHFQTIANTHTTSTCISSLSQISPWNNIFYFHCQSFSSVRVRITRLRKVYIYALKHLTWGCLLAAQPQSLSVGAFTSLLLSLRDYVWFTKMENSLLACLLAPSLFQRRRWSWLGGYNHFLMSMAFNCSYWWHPRSNSRMDVLKILKIA